MSPVRYGRVALWLAAPVAEQHGRAGDEELALFADAGLGAVVLDRPDAVA